MSVNPIISSSYATIAIMFTGLIMASIVGVEEKARWIQMINDVPERTATKYCENYAELSGSGRTWCENNNFGADGFTDNEAVSTTLTE